MRLSRVLTRNILLILSALLFTLTAACAQSPKSTVVRVGTSGTYAPFTFFDGDRLTGYDIEVVRLLDGRIDDVTFEFVTTGSFDGLVTGLDAGRYEMVAQQIAENAERKQKYLFPEYGYTFAETLLVVHGNETRTDLSEFSGETLGGLASDWFRGVLDEENEKLGNIFNVVSYEDYSQIFMDIDNGRIAGTLNDNIVIGYQSQHLGLNLKCVGEAVDSCFSYFLLAQDQADLRTKIDKALAEVIADGSLAKLSTEWFGADYTAGGK